MQQTWANNNDFPIPFTGIDPIIGQGQNRKSPPGPNQQQMDQEQKWRKENGDILPKDLSSFVTTRGGEYFFAPSIPFFKYLSVPSFA